MSYIINFERNYNINADFYNETMHLLHNKYNFPVYINIKEIVSGITGLLNQDANGILFLFTDDVCLSNSFLDNLKYTGETNKSKIKHYYSDYSLLNVPLKHGYDKYELKDFKILLQPKQKLSVNIFLSADNYNKYGFAVSGWIKFQVDRYPN